MRNAHESPIRFIADVPPPPSSVLLGADGRLNAEEVAVRGELTSALALPLSEALLCTATDHITDHVREHLFQ